MNEAVNLKVPRLCDPVPAGLWSAAWLQVQPHQDHQDILPWDHEHARTGKAHTGTLPHQQHQ